MQNRIASLAGAATILGSLGGCGSGVYRSDVELRNPGVYHAAIPPLQEAPEVQGSVRIAGVRRINQNTLCIDLLCTDSPDSGSTRPTLLRSVLYGARMEKSVGGLLELADANGRAVPISGCRIDPGMQLGVTGPHSLPPPVYTLESTDVRFVEIIVVPLHARIGSANLCQARLKHEWLAAQPSLMPRVQTEWESFKIARD